jgi:hypothetical protein
MCALKGAENNEKKKAAKFIDTFRASGRPI